ncbi:MAG: DUF2764 family protein [Bacteroidales bacterium]|nr:DUF2764 family protein [Bacteroidales bacterium]
MSNFEYIISSLPYLTVDFKYAEGQGFRQVIDEIKENLSAKDIDTLDFLLKGFKDDSLTEDFYAEALTYPLRFIREYFRFDLNLRNAKVRYLNRELGRPEELDLILGNAKQEDVQLDIDLYRFQPGEFEEEARVETALSLGDLLSREKELDDITWEKVNSLETFHYFDITAVLAYVAKLHIVNRWLALDEEKGRALFKQLVMEVKGTFKGVKFEA